MILFKASKHHKHITHTNTLQLQWHQVVCSGTIFSNEQHSVKIAPSEVYTACLEDSPGRIMHHKVCSFSQLVTYMSGLIITEQQLSKMKTHTEAMRPPVRVFATFLRQSQQKWLHISYSLEDQTGVRLAAFFHTA